MYLVYKYEIEEKTNQGPVIVGLFDVVPEQYTKYKYKKINNVYDPNQCYFILMEFSLVNCNSKFVVHSCFTDLKDLSTSGLEDSCYAIFKIQPNKPYPYSKESICWLKEYIFFQNLFISDNLNSLKRLEKMIKQNAPIDTHEFIHL